MSIVVMKHAAPPHTWQTELMTVVMPPAERTVVDAGRIVRRPLVDADADDYEGRHQGVLGGAPAVLRIAVDAVLLVVAFAATKAMATLLLPLLGSVLGIVFDLLGSG